ncbi:MAG: translation initiation factor IF-2 [Spirochaetes bacterium]|nr:translation initiation factor IF-2 [Spirochaetota bacterium]
MAEDQEKIEKPKIALIKQKKSSQDSQDNNQKNEQSDKPDNKKKVVVVKKKVIVIKKPGKTKENQEDDNTDSQTDTPADATRDTLHGTTGKPKDNEKKPSESKYDKADKTETAAQPPKSDKFYNKNKTGFFKQSSQPAAHDTNGKSANPENQSKYYRAKKEHTTPLVSEGSQGSKFPKGNFRDQKPRYGGASQSQGGTSFKPFQRQDGNKFERGDKKPGGPSQFRPRPPGKFGDKQQRFPTTPRTGGAEEIEKEIASAKPGAKKIFKAKKKATYQKIKKDQDIERNFQVKKKTVQKANPVPKEIDIMEVVTVAELAKKMNLKASDVISRFIAMGMMVTINQQVDAETAEIIASEYGCKVKIVSLYDETIVEGEKGDDKDIIERAPIVTVMGHVDHGKTKLLDVIRLTDKVASEHGGITQHIGAYKVSVNGRSIVFLDTPGHEAFTLMRSRGAQVTDVVVLVVAANDGVMPQTLEAIDHAKAAGVPIIVAINKIDLPEANPDRVKQQLSNYDLIPEDWGGKTIFCEISALKKLGIEELLENILLQADVLELKANPNCRAEGKIIESKVDHGRGIVATVLIDRGTLYVGDAFIAGTYSGRVRALFNDKGEKITSAPPATPVEILGFTGTPNAGDPFHVMDNEKSARQIESKRQELEKIGFAKNVKKVTLDNLYDSITDGAIQELKVIIKSDVNGSAEALKNALERLSTSEIKLNVIRASAGAIVENDVTLASASNAIIVGFQVRPTSKAQSLAEQEKVEIRKYNIIYDAVEDIRQAMEGLLAPELKEEGIGTAEVKDIFKVPKIGVIAGCFVTSGKVRRNGIAYLFREGVKIHSGKISSLKRFKDDAKEVEKNFECGIGLENYNDIRVGDVIEVCEIKEIHRKLEG